MPATITAVRLGKRSSVVRATSACSAGATSIDVLTVNHGLGVCPDILVPVLRSIRSVVSTGTPALTLRTWDATSAIFALPVADAGLTQADYDIIFQAIHSISK